VTVRLLHFTDVHFGIENTEACEAAVTFAHDARPDLVVVSGDITQKGLRPEFAAAAAWLARLPKPQITCPGNHDVPYYHTFGRVAYPWKRFDRIVGPLWRHGLSLPGLAVQSLNSARGLQLRLNWSKGVVDLDDVDTAVARLSQAPADALRVFVLHHPLVEVTGTPMTAETQRGREAAERLCAGEVDLIMTGHIHSPFANALPFGDGKTVATGASTLSRRERGTPAGFNQLDIDDDTIAVRALGWKGAGFETERTWVLSRRSRVASAAKAA
jgi:3',5'-cyclic AMP phosphodiesterase CpdA